MVRFVGLLLIFFCFVMGGNLVVKRERSRIEHAEGLLFLLRAIRRGAAYYRQPLGKIYDDFSCETLQKSGFLESLRQKGLKEAYCLHRDKFGLDAFTEGRFLMFSESVGRLVLEEQICSCDMMTELLEEKTNEAKVLFPTKKKLYSTLGITLGIGVVILFL